MASRARIGKPAVGFGDNGGMTESAVRHGQAKDTGTLVEGLGRDVLVLVRGGAKRMYQSEMGLHTSWRSEDFLLHLHRRKELCLACQHFPPTCDRGQLRLRFF